MTEPLYTEVDKNILATVRMYDSWSDTITVSVANMPDGGLYPITITNWRVEESITAKTVERVPGSGYPNDCNVWKTASTSILSLPMKTFLGKETKVIAGVTYPEIQGAGPGTFSGEYTKILFPCDKSRYIDGNTTDEILISPSPFSDESGLKDWTELVPEKYDALTAYMPDPTHDCTLTYHIYVYYTGGIIPGIPGDPETGTPETPPFTIPSGVEIHTVTQKVLNNTDANAETLRWLQSKQRTLNEQQALYKTGRNNPEFGEYIVRNQ